MWYRILASSLLVVFLQSCDRARPLPERPPEGAFLLEGTGMVRFEEAPPLRGETMKLYYHIPPAATPRSPILMVFHGGGRDARQSRDELIAQANRHHTLLLVPEFSRSLFPGGDAYNLGAVFQDGDNPSPSTLNPEARWTFSVVAPIFDYFRRISAYQTQEYEALGFSAGAQFLHRFLAFKPDARVSQAVAASAGWYTVPDDQIDFPYGLQKAPLYSDSLPYFFGQDLTVLVGEADDDPQAAALRRNAQADQQGSHRLARAQHFYQRSQAIATAAGHPFAWQYQSIPGVGHDFMTVCSYAMDKVLYP